jgi:hypothetical protein
LRRATRARIDYRDAARADDKAHVRDIAAVFGRRDIVVTAMRVIARRDLPDR